MTDLAARALSIAATARTRDTSDRERIQRENAALFAWRQGFIDTFAARPTYLRELATGREWGKAATGAVQASAQPKPGKLLRERR